MLFMLFSSVLGYLAISIDCKHAEKAVSLILYRRIIIGIADRDISQKVK